MAACLAFTAAGTRTGVSAESAAPLAADSLFVRTFDAAWKLINETYFDPTFGGLDWEGVRRELRPKAAQARDTEQLRSVIEEMLDRIGGSHMTLIPGNVADELAAADGAAEAGTLESTDAPGNREAATPHSPARPKRRARTRGAGEPGFEFRFTDGRALVTRVDPGGPAAREGIRPGWILTEIEGEALDQALPTLPKGTRPQQAHFLNWQWLTARLTGAPGTSIPLQFRDGTNQFVDVQAQRRPEPGELTQLGSFPALHARFSQERTKLSSGAKVGVIRFNLWMIPIVQKLDAAVDEFRNCDGIVMDLRGNLGGIAGMLLGVSGHFLKERISLGTLKMRGAELNFFANPRRVNSAGATVEPFSGPLAILIDDLSLSAAEIFAGGMQSVHRARIFGETSGGQALPAVWDRLPNGDVLYHAVGDFVTAQGTRLEGRGVTPDEPVRVTRQALLQGRDEVLEAAFRWIESQKAGRADAPGPIHNSSPELP